MLRKISCLYLFAALLLLTACGSETPAEVVEKFVNAQYKGKTEEAYNLLCSEDKQRISPEAFKNQQKELNDPMLKDFFAHAKIEILESKENGDTAEVTVNQEIPDIPSLLQASFKIAFNKDLKTDEERQKALLSELGGKIPASTIKIKYFTVKEDNAWKVKQPSLFNLFK